MKIAGLDRPRPWNTGKLVGPKPPFKLKEIPDLVQFNLAIDSKLREMRMGSRI